MVYLIKIDNCLIYDSSSLASFWKTKNLLTSIHTSKLSNWKTNISSPGHSLYNASTQDNVILFPFTRLSAETEGHLSTTDVQFAEESGLAKVIRATGFPQVSFLSFLDKKHIY